MGAKKISALTAATTPLDGTERLAAVQAGATVGVTVDDILSAHGGLTTTSFATDVVDTDPTLAADAADRLASQAAVKAYVDNAVTGLKWKASVLVATTANITLSGEQTIDGVLTSASRVLVKNQSTASGNGIYVSAAGAWARAADADTGAELVSATVMVEQGTAGAETIWTCSTNAITIGSTSIAFAQVAGAGAYSAGSGLTLTGNQFSFDSASTPTLAGLNLTSSSVAPLTITCTDSGASGGPTIILDRSSSSPANNDALGAFQFRGRNSAAASFNFGQVGVIASNVTAGAETSYVRLTSAQAGAGVEVMQVGGDGVLVTGASGGRKGVGTLNASALYINGADISTLSYVTAATFAGKAFLATGGSALRSLAARAADAVNVKDYGALGDGSADDTAAINAAYAVAITRTSAHLHFPPGTYVYKDSTLTVITDYVLFTGQGATVLFKGTGQWQLGDATHTIADPFFRDLTFKADATSSVIPLYVYATGRTGFSRCSLFDIRSSAISLRNGVVTLDMCLSRFASGAGTSVVEANIPSGQGAALFFSGGSYNAISSDHMSRCVVHHTGAGQLDGCVFLGVWTGDVDHVVNSEPTSGGHLSNCMSFGCLFDQVDQYAFRFAGSSGSRLNDVAIVGNKINGWGSSTATSGALITLDLSSGATHGDFPFVVADNVLTNCRRRGIEVLGGTYKRVRLSGNTITEYGTSANAASRAIYVSGSAAFDMLEVSDNTLSTTNTHDYAIELATGVTATSSKVEGNSVAGTAASLANINTSAFASHREMLRAARTYYVRTDGSDSNAGLANSAAGGFLTLQAAWTAISRLDLNGFTVTLQVGDGTYAGGLSAAAGPPGNGTVVIQGNTTIPANCIISTTSADCFLFSSPLSALVLIKGFKLLTATSGVGINVTNKVYVDFDKIEFGACAAAHLNCQAAGGQLRAVTTGATYTISGATPGHISAANGARASIAAATVTITGTPAITIFAQASKSGLLEAGFGLSISGSITGKKYAVTTNGIIDNGGLANFPGGTAGTTATQGQYL